MPTRLLALVAAVAMVAGAMFVRGRLDQREEDKVDRPQLHCVTELLDVCRALGTASTEIDVILQSAGDTIDLITALEGDKGIDAWLTIEPWADMAEQARRARSLPDLFERERLPIGRSPVGAAVWPDRLQAMTTHCKTPNLTWKCLGQVAAKKQWADVTGGNAIWGPVKVGLANAEDHPVALTILAAATQDYFGGRTDLSSADLEDPGFQDWLTALKDTAPTAQRSFNEVLAAGPSVADVHASTEAEVLGPLNASARLPKPVLIYPSPVMTADLVLVTVAGRAGDRLREIVEDEVRKDMAEAGWRVEGEQVPKGATLPIPAGNGLPDAGFLAALRLAWKAA